MKVVVYFNFFFFILLLYSCQKDMEVQPKAYPYIITKEVSDISESGIVFNGKIISLGNSEITEYGFIWDVSDPKIEFSNRIVVGTQNMIGTFNKKVDQNIFKDKEQSVRAYLITEDKMVYGNCVTFVCNGGKSPILESIVPLSGYSNSKVTLQGKNFGGRKAGIKVLFGERVGVIDSCTDNEIIVTVPDVDQDSEDFITIDIYGKSVKSIDPYKTFTYWKKIKDFPGPQRYVAVSFAINDKGYVGTGRNSEGDYFNDFWEYDPLINIWNRKADVPGNNRAYALGFSINGEGYIGFGHSPYGVFSDPEYDLWKYDPDQNNWSILISDSRTGGGIAYYRNASFVINNECYIVFSTTQVYNPLINEFMYSSDFPGPYRDFTSGCSSGNYGYVFAGQTPGNQLLKDLWEFDLNNNYWVKKSELPGEVRDMPICFSLDTRLFFGLGRGKNDLFEYNRETDTWTELEEIPVSVAGGATVFTIKNKAYIGTGIGNPFFFEFDPNKK